MNWEGRGHTGDHSDHAPMSLQTERGGGADGETTCPSPKKGLPQSKKNAHATKGERKERYHRPRVPGGVCDKTDYEKKSSNILQPPVETREGHDAKKLKKSKKKRAWRGKGKRIQETKGGGAPMLISKTKKKKESINTPSWVAPTRGEQ